MAEKTLKTRIIMRSGTTAEWEQWKNAALQPGEIGIEFCEDNTVKMKVGNKIIDEWEDLPYFGGMKAFVNETTLHIK